MASNEMDVDGEAKSNGVAAPQTNGHTNGTSAHVNGNAPAATGPHVPDVCVVGAGPAGLMLADLLARFGIDVEILDERADQTGAGRADGLQPKTVETFRMLRLSDKMLRRGTKVYDICFWKGTPTEPLRRLGRAVHYPPEVVDLMDDHLLLVHQGMVEEIFIDDLKQRGVEVYRNHHFEALSQGADGLLKVDCTVTGQSETRSGLARVVVGCDGARSRVRRCIPETQSAPNSSHGESVWGVLDGELDTDFPDLWSKAVIYSEEHGSILLIPRERNMTRFYIEIKPGKETGRLRDKGQEFVMQRAKNILAPYNVEWKTVDWFGNYTVGQRVAGKFANPELNAFIAGDASHTHSPKAAQGMNTSMHDGWNLAWKLNLALRGLAKPALLESYEQERCKIAHDLINFDYEHAQRIAGGDEKALAENFRTNIRFIAGVGVEYDQNVLNAPAKRKGGELKEGCLPPPGKVTRYIDANPVDIQIDIPILGQFRIYLFVSDIHRSSLFLDTFCDIVSMDQSFVSRLSRAAALSYRSKPRRKHPEEMYVRSDRYTTVSELMTFALVTTMDKTRVEITDLPPLLAMTPWTFYLDDVPHLDTRGSRCTTKWLGEMGPSEVGVVIIRPDGYVGSLSRYDSLDEGTAEEASQWVDNYFARFMQIPPEPEEEVEEGEQTTGEESAENVDMEQ